MKTRNINLPSRTIEIPDGLVQPFRELGSLMESLELKHPLDLLKTSKGEELFKKCDQYVIATIGKRFAHELAIGQVVDEWLSTSTYERVVQILSAANNTEPLALYGVRHREGILT